jgi:hypothetical protein
MEWNSPRVAHFTTELPLLRRQLWRQSMAWASGIEISVCKWQCCSSKIRQIDRLALVKTTHCVGPWQTIKNIHHDPDSTFPVEMAVETPLPTRSADNFSIIWCGTTTKIKQAKKQQQTKTKTFFLSSWVTTPASCRLRPHLPTYPTKPSDELSSVPSSSPSDEQFMMPSKSNIRILLPSRRRILVGAQATHHPSSLPSMMPSQPPSTTPSEVRARLTSMTAHSTRMAWTKARSTAR